MINTDKFTRKSLKIIDNAIKAASSMGHTYVGSEHILYALLNDGSSNAAKLLSINGMDSEMLYNEIIHMVGQGNPSALNQRYFTTALKKILESSYTTAVSDNKKQATPEHILISIINDSSCSGSTLMKKMNINIIGISSNLNRMMSKEVQSELSAAFKPKASQFPNLFKYGQNLTDMAIAKKHDPLIGRNKEVEHVLRFFQEEQRIIHVL